MGFSKSEEYEWSDGVKVSVIKVSHAKMTKADVEDSDPDGKPGEDLVRFYVRVTNGSDDALDDVYGEATVSYGSDGSQADRRYPLEQEYEEFGTIRAGRAKTTSQTFAVPRKYQDDVTLDFDLDGGTHEVATFAGSVK